MQMRNKKKKTYKRFLKGVRFFAAVFFSLVFLCSCNAKEPVIPSSAALQSSFPSESGTEQVAPTLLPQTTASLEAAPSETIAEYEETAVCTANEYVNIRDRAGADGSIIGRMPAKETAGVLTYEDGWAKVFYRGVTGYVSMEYLMFQRNPDAPLPEGEWTQILVGPQNLLPKDFSVELADFKSGAVDARILDICTEMFFDAGEDGVTLKLVDAYRSRELQSELYAQKVQSYLDRGYSLEEAEATAATITARPDTSEHQTGLALDIVTDGYTSRDSGFAATKAFKWLDANAANYGFILRYPKGRTDITGVIYEPWHWRYVGEAAPFIKKSGTSLEEYLRANG